MFITGIIGILLYLFLKLGLIIAVMGIIGVLSYGFIKYKISPLIIRFIGGFLLVAGVTGLAAFLVSLRLLIMDSSNSDGWIFLFALLLAVIGLIIGGIGFLKDIKWMRFVFVLLYLLYHFQPFIFRTFPELKYLF